MSFNEEADPFYLNNNIYDALRDGDLDPSDFLVNKAQLNKVKAAIDTLKEFEEGMYESGLLTD